MTYLFNDAGRAMTYREWRKLGGCGPSNYGEAQARSHFLSQRRYMEDCTLGEIQDVSIVAARGMARYAAERMGRGDLTREEYPD